MPPLSTVVAVLGAVWLATALPLSALYPAYAQRLALLRPNQRAWLLRLVALTPALLSVLACIELFVIPGELVPAHCHLTHCSAHNPDTQPEFSTVAGIVSIVFLPLLLLALRLLWSTTVLQRQWQRLSEPADGYRYLDIAQAIACVVGLLRPTIYFSRGFIARLSPVAVRVVVAHERAHAVRYDNLWMALIRVCSLGWIHRARLLADLELAQEQACDQRAAEVVGDAVAVAETLLQCQRLAQAPQVASAFFRGQLDARVRLLLDPSHVPLSPLAVLRFGSLALLLIAALVIPLHYFIELI